MEQSSNDKIQMSNKIQNPNVLKKEVNSPPATSTSSGFSTSSGRVINEQCSERKTNELSPRLNRLRIQQGRRNHPPSLARHRRAGFGGQAKIRKHERKIKWCTVNGEQRTVLRYLPVLIMAGSIPCLTFDIYPPIFCGGFAFWSLDPLNPCQSLW